MIKKIRGVQLEVAFINNMKIKYKILSMVLIMVAFIAAIGFIGYSKIQQTGLLLDDMYSKQLVPIKNLNNYRNHFRFNETNLLKMMLATDKTKVESIAKDIENRDKMAYDTINTYVEKRVALDSGIQEQFDILMTDMKEYTEVRGQIVELVLKGQTKEAFALYQSKNYTTPYTKAINGMTTIINDSSKAAKAVNDANQAFKERAMKQMIIIIAAALVLAVLLGWWLAVMITRPVQHLVQVANSVSEGNLAVNQLRVTRKDEIGHLSYAMNNMVMHLRAIIQEVLRSSNLVATASEKLSKESEQVRGASVDTAKMIQHMNDGFQEQLTSIHESSKAIEEMAKGIGDIASSSENVAASSNRSYEKATHGKEVIENAVKVIRDLSTGVSEYALEIQALGDKTKEIDQVVELISTISSQTNLLALNAGIEAARAGEHGRGFAVVAGEVKKLAEESRKASAHVSELIQAIQDETLQLVERISNATVQAKEGASSAEKADDSFSEISTEVESVSNQIIYISATVEQMSAGSEEILATMQSLVHIAEQSAGSTDKIALLSSESVSSMEEVRNSVTELNSLAEGLHQVIGRFKL